MEKPMRDGVRIASVAFVVVLCALLSATAIANARSVSRPNRIRIAYVPPVDVAHQPIYELLKQRRILERFRDLLSFLRLPRPLLLKVAGCDGDANAWYDHEEREVTVCYEYVAHIQRIAPTETIGGVTPENAVVGPVVEVFLHEVGHALFDLLRVPILGREEDAADQLAAYIMLQLGKEFARTTIVGVAWMYAQDAQGTTIDRSAFADVHSLDAQRFYNVLCLAYGADPKLFADTVEKKHLPEDRAEGCADEYQQVAYAVQKLLSPHVDKVRAKKVRAKNPLRPEVRESTETKAPSHKP
jgi:Putative metallopeptidase